MPETNVEFDLCPITLGLVKITRRKCPSSSSPSIEQLTYFHLRNLTSTHYFLATLFTKIVLESHHGPSLWYSAKINLIPKGGDPSNPKIV